MAALIPVQLALLLLAQTSTYSVSGRVTFEDGQPIESAEVFASTHGWDAVGDIALTDAKGRFSVTGLPGGIYMMSASRDDIGPIFLRQTARPLTAIGVKLNDTSPHPNIDYHVSRPATITGTARTSSGAPMRQAQVFAERHVWIDGQPTLRDSASSTTDDRGRFRIAQLTRGRWSVCAVAVPQPVLPIGIARFGDKPKTIYTEACYPEGSKAPVKLSAGQILDVDIVFHPTFPVIVSGRVDNSEGFDFVSVQLTRDSAPAGRVFDSVNPDPATHSFRFARILPGRYHISAQAHTRGKPDRDLPNATTTLSVGDSDQVVDLTLASPPRITATVHTPPHDSQIDVSLRAADDPHHPTYDAELQPDGTLFFPVPYPGRYWLITRGHLCPADVRVEELGHPSKSEIQSHGIQILTSMRANLDITFTATCGGIEGTAVDSTGKPLALVSQLILLAGTAEDPGDLMQTYSGEDGSFGFEGLAPGKYPLWAVSEDDDWDGILPALSDLASQQTVVEVLPHRTTSIKLPLVRSSN